jgi:hypothetical protein
MNKSCVAACAITALLAFALLELFVRSLSGAAPAHPAAQKILASSESLSLPPPYGIHRPGERLASSSREISPR